MEPRSCSDALSPQALHALLVRAAEAVRQVVAHRDSPPRVCPDCGLLASRGVFVTLYRDHELAGCIGFATPQGNLWESVGRAARKAACEDGRFAPIELEDEPVLEVEVSVLGELRPTTVDAFGCGRHGLLVRSHGRQALLLPQVATRHGFDRAGFLAALCHKAGLPARIWSETDTELWAFEAQIAQARYRDLLACVPLSADGTCT